MGSSSSSNTQSRKYNSQTGQKGKKKPQVRIVDEDESSVSSGEVDCVDEILVLKGLG